jgi:hypothetical protein
MTGRVLVTGGRLQGGVVGRGPDRAAQFPVMTLEAGNVDDRFRNEMAAGWVSVLVALKAATDFGVDLRNHDPERTWEQRFVDN